MKWQVKKLGEVCEIKPPKKEARDRLKENELVSFVPMEDLGILKKYFIPTQERKLKEVAGSYTYFADDDVLLAKITPCFENGKLGIAKNLTNGIGFGSSEYVVFRPDDSLNSEYLYYYLSREDFRKEGASVMSGAVGHKRVPKEFIENQEIPLPPLPEQKRIVGILDEVFRAAAQAKENAEKNLANAKALFESYLQNIFANPGKDWEEKKLGDISKITDGTHFSPKNQESGEYMYITAKNIKPYYIDLSKISYVTKKDHKEIYSRCPVKKGDVLYIKDGATTGIAALNTIDEEFSLLSSVALFKVSDQILNTYLVHYMNSGFGRKNFLGYIGGTAITRLTLIKLKNVIINLPPISEQKIIVTKLDTLSAETKKLEAIYTQKLTALEELKKSVLKQAFEGRL